MVATVEAAAISPQGIVYSPGKSAIPTGRVWTLGSVITMSAKKNSFHAWIKTNSAAVRIPGAASGRITLYNACSRLQALYKVILPLAAPGILRSEEHTSELQSHSDLVCRLLLEK